MYRRLLNKINLIIINMFIFFKINVKFINFLYKNECLYILKYGMVIYLCSCELLFMILVMFWIELIISLII